MNDTDPVDPFDMWEVAQFTAFLSWGIAPSRPGTPPLRRHVPPAWFAYAWGLTRHCPPRGTA